MLRRSRNTGTTFPGPERRATGPREALDRSSEPCAVKQVPFVRVLRFEDAEPVKDQLPSQLPRGRKYVVVDGFGPGSVDLVHAGPGHQVRNEEGSAGLQHTPPLGKRDGSAFQVRQHVQREHPVCN